MCKNFCSKLQNSMTWYLISCAYNEDDVVRQMKTFAHFHFVSHLNSGCRKCRQTCILSSHLKCTFYFHNRVNNATRFNRIYVLPKHTNAFNYLTSKCSIQTFVMKERDFKNCKRSVAVSLVQNKWYLMRLVLLTQRSLVHIPTITPNIILILIQFCQFCQFVLR